MPELSDVEGFRRYFARFAAGRRVTKVRVPDADLLRDTSAQAIGRAVKGKRLGDPERHGKWLMAPAEGPWILMHFGMTGRLAWAQSDGERHRHDRLILVLAGGGELRYRNMRKFGGVWLARSEAERESVTGPLGPDAMDLDRGALGELLERRRGAIKPTLMDQRVLAGIGNLLADEILWQARINPRHPARELGSRRLDVLDSSMREVLRVSNRHGRIPRHESWLTGVRDDPDARCPRCGTRLRRDQVGGRTTRWCPRCQRR